MAHHTRVRANSAAWSAGSVTQAEWEKFDANLFKSINGDEGGVWAPSSVIEIGGSGVDVSGLFLASGDAQIGTTSADALTIWSTTSVVGPITFGLTTFGGTATFNGSLVANGNVTLGNASGDALTVIAASTFQNTATFLGQVIVGDNPADSFDCISQAQFYNEATFLGYALFNDTLDVQGDLAVNGPATFDNQVDFDADVTIGSNSADALLVHASSAFFSAVTFSGTTEFIGQPLFTSPMSFSGSGRMLMRTGATSNASGSYSPTTANIWRVAPTTISALRTYSINNTGAVDGDWLWFGIGPQSFTLEFEDHLGASLITYTSGQQGYVLFVRMSGTWRILGYTRH